MSYIKFVLLVLPIPFEKEREDTSKTFVTHRRLSKASRRLTLIVLGLPASPCVLIDSDNSHPLVEWLELGQVLVAEGFQVTGPPGTLDLISSNLGPILAMHQRTGFQDAVLGFEFRSENEAGDLVGWDDHPNLDAYLDRFLERPAVRKGLNIPPRN